MNRPIQKLMLLLLALICLLPALARGQSGTWMYVHADLLRLRTEPSAQAGVVARLRPGTPVRSLETDGDWHRVSVGQRPDEHAVTGWVHGDYLGPRSPTPDMIPWRSPDGRVHLAQCRGHRAVLLGAIDAAGRFEALDLRGEAAREAALALAGELSVQPWQGTTRFGSIAVEGTPFLRPFLAPQHSETDGSAWGPGEDTMGVGSVLLVLGPCPTVFTGGDLLTTTTIERLRQEPATWQDLLGAHDVVSPYLEDLLGLDVARAPGGGDLSTHLTEIGVVQPWTRFGCGGEGEDTRARTLWITRGGQLQVAMGVGVDRTALPQLDHALGPRHVAPASWHRLHHPDLGWLTLGIAEGRDNLDDSLVVLIDDGRLVRASHVVMETWGC